MSRNKTKTMTTYEASTTGSNLIYSQNFGCFRWLATVRLYRLIAALLVVLITVPLVTHYYLSKVATEGSNQDIHHTRLKLEAIEESGILKAADLKQRVEELIRIKVSVANELIDLENKRQRYVAEISLYNQKIDELKQDVSRYQQELDKYKLFIEQAKYAQKEALRKNRPDLQAPKRILPSWADLTMVPTPQQEHSLRCRMHLCFDHSRCSFTSGFPVYYYNPEDDDRPAEFHLDALVKSSITYALSVNPHITFDPHIACIFVVLLGTSSQNFSRAALGKYLQSLSHWQGDGRNHVLVNLQVESNSSDVFHGVDIGRAMIVQTPFAERQFRSDFDIVVPPLMAAQLPSNFWETLPPYSPAHRNYLISFQGELPGVNPASQVPSSSVASLSSLKSSNVSEKSESVNVNKNSSTLDDLKSVEVAIVSSLKKIYSSSTEDNFDFQFICSGKKLAADPSEWALCEPAASRENILLESTFALIISPSNWSLVSTATTHLRLYEALKCGAVPIILGDYVQLPFSEFIEWSRAAVVLPKARGRLIWEKYLSSTQTLIDTTIALLRTRLKIPALPAREEPSPSVFNSTFVPLKLETLLPDIDPDESMGPTETPYPSPNFRRNFTQTMINAYEVWNILLDPFALYPYTPFDSILPSEAKFLGSGIGFRPIGHGAGGSGKEFSEALGGNVPREQFTIVMLTYEREAVLINSLQRLYGLSHLNKVVVIWNSPKPPSEDLRWPEIGVPIHVVKAKRNSLNNRFLPYDAIETEAVLSVDDDAHLRHDEIMFGFRVWREARDRIVGFPGRYHAWDLKHGGWLYNSNYSCELSMVLTGAAFFHKYYAYLYTNVMPQSIRDKVDEYMNCEDIAMNFLVSHITRKPPLKVTSRWTFRCPGCPVALSEDNTHFQERHTCINFFYKVYGYMPLLNTQFRVDSVLFKTRLPHDKQKCFKFI